MKRTVSILVLMLGTLALSFAQGGPMGGPMGGPGGKGAGRPGMGPLMENLKPGEQVIHEYKKITGTLLFADRLIPSVKEGTNEYTLVLPRMPQFAGNPKQGDPVTMEGIAITYKKADGKTELFFHPLKGKIGDKEFNMEDFRGKDGGKRGMMDRGPRW